MLENIPQRIIGFFFFSAILLVSVFWLLSSSVFATGTSWTVVDSPPSLLSSTPDASIKTALPDGSVQLQTNYGNFVDGFDIVQITQKPSGVTSYATTSWPGLKETIDLSGYDSAKLQEYLATSGSGSSGSGSGTNSSGSSRNSDLRCRTEYRFSRICQSEDSTSIGLSSAGSPDGSSAGFPTLEQAAIEGGASGSAGSGSSGGQLTDDEEKTLFFGIPNVLGISDAGQLMDNILTIVFFIAGLFFFVNLMVGGIQWITAGGDPKALEMARSRLTHAFIGLLIVVAAFSMAVIVETVLGVPIVSGVCIPTPSGPCPAG